MTETHPQVERARALHPLLQHEGAEVNRRRELTQPIVRALKDGNFFRMLQPRSIGGMEMKPSDFARVTEAVASADGSTGWVVCQSNGCSMSAAYLDPNVAREIFGSIDGILAWARRARRTRPNPSPADTASPAPGASPAAPRTPPGSVPT